jgi:hypothetical protein
VVTVSCEPRNGACSHLQVRRTVGQRRHQFLRCFDPNSSLFLPPKCPPAGRSAETPRGQVNTTSGNRRRVDLSASAPGYIFRGSALAWREQRSTERPHRVIETVFVRPTRNYFQTME